jgi:hypothetical protein
MDSTNVVSTDVRYLSHGQIFSVSCTDEHQRLAVKAFMHSNGFSPPAPGGADTEVIHLRAATHAPMNEVLWG